KADNEKTTAETEAKSMVSVIIQLDTSVIPPMTTPVVDLTSRPESPNVHRPLQVSKVVDEIFTDAVDWAIQAPLRNRFRDLPEADMKEILHQRMWETNSYKTHEDYKMLHEALEKSMNCDHSKELAKDLAEVRKKKKKRRGQSQGFTAPSSSKTTASAEYQAWTTTDTGLRPFVSLTPADLQIDDDMAPDAQAQLSDDEDIRNAHIPKVNLRQDWWKPLKEER
nr:hypothetical protein [Tanacetum cinerariifolium]